MPVMIRHGTADGNIPVTEARLLYAAAHEPKVMIEVEGAGHLEAWEGGGREPALKPNFDHVLSEATEKT